MEEGGAGGMEVMKAARKTTGFPQTLRRVKKQVSQNAAMHAAPVGTCRLWRHSSGSACSRQRCTDVFLLEPESALGTWAQEFLLTGTFNNCVEVCQPKKWHYHVSEILEFKIWLHSWADQCFCVFGNVLAQQYGKTAIFKFKYWSYLCICSTKGNILAEEDKPLQSEIIQIIKEQRRADRECTVVPSNGIRPFTRS